MGSRSRGWRAASIALIITACGLPLDYVVGPPSPAHSSLAMTFDGVDEDITIADHADFFLPTQMSAFVWVKADAANLGAGNAFLAHRNNAGNQRAWSIEASAGSNDQFRVFISDDGSQGGGAHKLYRSSVIAFDGTWRLIGFTWNAGTLKIYADGEEDTARTASNDAPIVAIHDSTGSVTIGNIDGNQEVQAFIDEPAIWNTTLTAAEIRELYNHGKPMNLSLHSRAANLVSWWRLGDATGDSNTASIDVISGHNGTVNNMEAADIVTDVP